MSKLSEADTEVSNSNSDSHPTVDRTGAFIFLTIISVVSLHLTLLSYFYFDSTGLAWTFGIDTILWFVVALFASPSEWWN